MGKIIGKFSLIMVINLLAFLSVGYILDLFFESNGKFIIIFLVLSIFSLALVSKSFFKKALKDMEKISPKEKDTHTQSN